MHSKAILSKGACFVLLSVLGASVMSGCRSNKSAFSFASPQQPSTSYVSTEPQSNTAPGSLPVMTAPAAAASYSSPSDSTFTPTDYTPTPSKSSSGCASGCCSG